MNRAVLAAVTLLLLIASAAGQVTLSVPTVGLNDTFSNSPQAVVFQITNKSAQSGAYNVEVQVRFVTDQFDRAIVRHTADVQLSPSETRQFEFPITVPIYGGNVVRVVVRDAKGKEIARRELKDPRNSNVGIIAGLCDDKTPHCTGIWTSILSNSNDEQTERKQKKLSVVAIRNPGSHYWSYTPARFVVLARSASGLSPEVRRGLEEHVRMGGVLIWAAKEVGPTDWLAAYRDAAKGESTRVMGRGIVYTIPSVDSPLLSQLFNRETVTDVPSYMATLRAPYYAGGTYNFDSRYQTHFNFPSLWWLLIWLVVYILVAGVANFAVLRMVRKLELGWITVPLIAIIFATAIFFVSSAKRPRNIIVDQVARYQLDTHSPIAAADYSVRVSTPSNLAPTLSVPRDAVWNVTTASYSFRPTDLAREILELNKDDGGIELRYGERNEYPFRLLRWSYEDVTLQGLRTFQGSVVRVSPTRLRNETGIDFRSALFVDLEAKVAYVLDRVPAGAEVDLTKFKSRDIEEISKEETERRQKGDNTGPFRLTEVLTDGGNGTAFYALSDGAALGATLKGLNPEQHNTSLFIVGMQ